MILSFCFRLITDGNRSEYTNLDDHHPSVLRQRRAPAEDVEEHPPVRHGIDSREGSTAMPAARGNPSQTTGNLSSDGGHHAEQLQRSAVQLDTAAHKLKKVISEQGVWLFQALGVFAIVLFVKCFSTLEWR